MVAGGCGLPPRPGALAVLAPSPSALARDVDGTANRTRDEPARLVGDARRFKHGFTGLPAELVAGARAMLGAAADPVARGERCMKWWRGVRTPPPLRR